MFLNVEIKFTEYLYTTLVKTYTCIFTTEKGIYKINKKIRHIGFNGENIL